jgi:hypothetical protein
MREIDKLRLRESCIREELRCLEELFKLSSPCALLIETEYRQDIVERLDDSSKLCASLKIRSVPIAHAPILARRE